MEPPSKLSSIQAAGQHLFSEKETGVLVVADADVVWPIMTVLPEVWIVHQTLKAVVPSLVPSPCITTQQ